MWTFLLWLPFPLSSQPYIVNTIVLHKSSSYNDCTMDIHIKLSNMYLYTVVDPLNYTTSLAQLDPRSKVTKQKFCFLIILSGIGAKTVALVFS